MTLRLCIRTVGCRTNQADSLALELASGDAGAVITDDVEQADVVVVNSCAVTSRAARDTRRLVAQARRLAPRSLVIVAGCLVEVEDDALLAELGADRIVRNADKARIARMVRELAPAGPGPAPAALRSMRPALKVQEGCTVGCAYCIVPRTRGPERSLPAGEVVRAAARLAGRGAREVVLTGTQLGAWGRDLEPAQGLADLVDRLIGGSVARRVRLSSIEPWGWEPALVRMIAGRRQGLCAHAHVPLQTGSARIHEAMGRPGGPDAWEVVVTALRAGDRPPAVGTDVLVGYPGEEEADFEATRDLVVASACAYLHVFRFSPRPGTPAAPLVGRPDERVVKRRVALLRELSRQMRQAYLSSLVGARLEVIVERMDRQGSGALGTSSEFARVVVEDGREDHVGRLVSARARGVGDERLVARLEEVIE
jgi:threonylcarbamoyladenosine tRNA methylthiotransferase MtaB